MPRLPRKSLIFFLENLSKIFSFQLKTNEYKSTFPGSSVVEQVTVNHLVGGSNPSQGAI